MKKRFLAVIPALVIFFMLGQGGWCADPIKIGLIGALGTPAGLANKVSLEIGVEELNKAGGILGSPVELVVKDSKRELPLTVAAYKQLVMSEKCLMVFTEGTEGSSACMQEGSRMFQDITFGVNTAVE